VPLPYEIVEECGADIVDAGHERKTLRGGVAGAHALRAFRLGPRGLSSKGGGQPPLETPDARLVQARIAGVERAFSDKDGVSTPAARPSAS
jgi:hypothetical protein